MVHIRGTNITVTFGRGNFDDYCVYIVHCNNQKIAPRDEDYFTFFQNLQNQHLNIMNIYNDFVSIYDEVGGDFDENVINRIHELVDQYCNVLSPNELQDLEKYYVVIYMAMIAEENKKNTKLGKRIKRLGMHNLLVNNMTPNESANSSRGQTACNLNQQMQDHGF